jgi:hypothetical protein
MRKRSENGGETIQCKVFKYLMARRQGAQCKDIAADLGVGLKATEDAVRAMLEKGLLHRRECKVQAVWARKGKPYDVTYNAVKYLTVKGKKPPKDMRGKHPASREAARLEYNRTPRNMPRRPIATYGTALEQCFGIRPDSPGCDPKASMSNYAGEITSEESVDEAA